MNKDEKPKHSYWAEGDFIQERNEKGKLIAHCKVCNKILQNTAINRLKNYKYYLLSIICIKIFLWKNCK